MLDRDPTPGTQPQNHAATRANLYEATTIPTRASLMSQREVLAIFLVERDFTASAPNVLWLTDITEHWTSQGKLYMCAIKDVYSSKIVGYSIGPRMKAELAVTALRNALALRGPVPGCVVHSDRGNQFRSKAFVRMLKNNGLKGSMGRVGACPLTG